MNEIEEAKTRNLIAAVEAAGYDCADPASLAGMTATLRIGRITTELSAFDAQIQTAVARQAAASADTDAAVSQLRARQEEKRADLRKLLGAA